MGEDDDDVGVLWTDGPGAWEDHASTSDPLGEIGLGSGAELDEPGMEVAPGGRHLSQHREMSAPQDPKHQLERLEEENSSLRAISKYLMQERKELVRKAEAAFKRNQNLRSLMPAL